MMSAKRTEPRAPARKAEHLVLVVILLLAAGLRTWHLGFGLPALNDPDEPIFIMTALDMLREGRLNPSWFGHPATLLFYLLAIVIVAVGALGSLSGAWGGSDAFVAAVFVDPGILVLPMRGLSVAFGVASVWLTWRLGRRIGGARVGLPAALLLACNGVHVELSQVIRTDMLATALMGWSTLYALAVARGGGKRDLAWAGAAAGLACAAKWPAVLVLAAPISALLWQARSDRRALRLLPLAPLTAVATLVLASPYLILDYPTLLRDLGSEARPVHLGSTGHGVLGNFAWYLRHPLAGSFGWGGLALAALGTSGTLRRPAAAVVLLPTGAVIVAALAMQALVWERWIVPLLPIVAILIAIGIGELGRRLAPQRADRLGAAVVLILAGWMTYGTLDRIGSRASDPRQAATAWVSAHVPTAGTILVEHAAFDLLQVRGRLLFPLGSAGCVDVRAALGRAPSYRRVDGLRQGRPIVDVGHVDASRLHSCDADVVILSNFARYRAEPERFGPELSIYRQLLARHRCVASFSNPRMRALDPARRVEVCVRVPGSQVSVPATAGRPE